MRENHNYGFYGPQAVKAKQELELADLMQRSKSAANSVEEDSLEVDETMMLGYILISTS